jgi:hypothetical protein
MDFLLPPLVSLNLPALVNLQNGCVADTVKVLALQSRYPSGEGGSDFATVLASC